MVVAREDGSPEEGLAVHKGCLDWRHDHAWRELAQVEVHCRGGRLGPDGAWVGSFQGLGVSSLL